MVGFNVVLSRLKALKRMGIVNNYEDIRNKTVAVVGVGGVGSGKNPSQMDRFINIFYSYC